MMQHSRRIILRSTWFGIFLSIVIFVKAQEMWGVTASNYSGSTGVLINPTSISISKLYQDVNIMAFDIFLENNYAYIPQKDYSLFGLISGKSTLPKYGPDGLPFDHYTTKNNKFVYSSQVIKGPSYMVAIGRSAFAFHTGARMLTSAYDIPLEIANFGYYGLKYKPQHNTNYNSSNFGSTALSLGEIGLTYAYDFRKISMESWTAGITVNRLFSLGGGYLSANNVNYIVVNDSAINFKNLNAEIGYSLPLDYNTNAFPDSGPLVKGGGFGFDIGVTFQNKVLSYQRKRISKLCRQRYIDYYYRIGVSLLDVGFVNFRKNTQVQTFDNVSQYWMNIDTLKYINVNHLASSLSQVFYGDPNASHTADKMRVFLPTAFSVQADYRIYRNWYAGAILIHPIKLGKAFIRRPAQVVLIPRYETHDLEFSLPLSLYDYHHFRIGASVRYNWLTFGSDDLLGLFGINDFTGIDFYLAVKINFRKGFCGRYGRNVPCENEEYGIRKKR
jgi:hypothetical protein